MTPIDLSPILKDYEGQWVALSDDYKAVFGNGRTAKEAAENARAKGHLDYTLLYVQPFDLLYCG